MFHCIWRVTRKRFLLLFPLFGRFAEFTVISTVLKEFRRAPSALDRKIHFTWQKEFASSAFCRGAESTVFSIVFKDFRRAPSALDRKIYSTWQKGFVSSAFLPGCWIHCISNVLTDFRRAPSALDRNIYFTWQKEFASSAFLPGCWIHCIFHCFEGIPEGTVCTWQKDSFHLTERNCFFSFPAGVLNSLYFPLF